MTPRAFIHLSVDSIGARIGSEDALNEVFNLRTQGSLSQRAASSSSGLESTYGTITPQRPRR